MHPIPQNNIAKLATIAILWPAEPPWITIISVRATNSITWDAFAIARRWFMGLIHLTRVFTTYVDDMSHWLCLCVRVFEESSSISSLDLLQIVSNTTLAHSHLQLPTGYELSVTLDKCKR